MHRLLLSFLLCFALVAGALPAAAQGSLDTAKMEAYLKELMATYDVPGVGLALIQDGKIVYEGGLGVRSTASKAPVTANTLFAIGSITKSFTALAIMQLVEQGKLDLDTPVLKYLPDFKLSDEAATKTVTLRHLLSHSSGLPRSDEWFFDTSITREQVLKDVASITLTAKPGETWQYSNQNYVIAGAVLEKITGQSWETYVKANIFDPLGMKTADTDIVDMQKAPDFALPHRLNVPAGMEPIPFRGLQAVGPAGSINASIHDMARYALFQLGDGTFNGTTLVKQASLDEMHRKQIAIPPSGGLASIDSYGFAWLQETFREVSLVEHDGAINGFYADVTLVPSKKAAVVLLTNADAATIFTNSARLRLVSSLLGLSEEDYSNWYNMTLALDPVVFKEQMEKARAYKPAPKEFDPLLGDLTGPLGTLPVSLKDGKLFITQTVGQTKVDIELVPFDKYQFLSNGTQIPWFVFRFEIDDQGTVKLFQGTSLIGQRLGAGVKEVQFKDPEGRYTFTVPNPLVAQTAQGLNLVVIISTTPKANFFIEAIKAEGTDPKANLERWLLMHDPNGTKQEPVNVREVPLPSGLKWTQYIYQLPSDQLLVALVMQQGDFVYFVSVTAATQDIQSLTPALNTILLSFTPTK